MSDKRAKTHKGLAKRIKVTGSGKVKFKRPGNSHLASHKPGYRVRQLRRKAIMSGSFAKKLAQMVGPAE